MNYSSASAMRSLSFFVWLSFLSQFSYAQIEMLTERNDEGDIELYATNTSVVPFTILINYTELTNINSSGLAELAVVRPGKRKVATLKPRVEGQSTDLRYTYSFVKGDIFGKQKEEPLYLIPLPEGTITTGIRMTHIKNRLQPTEEVTDYVGVSFQFSLPTDIVAPRKGIVSEISIDKYPEKGNLDFDRSENYIELYHEDGSLTKVMVLKPGSEKVKVGQVVFPGDVIAESAGEDYNSGLHVRIVNMRPAKNGKDKLHYEMDPMKFVSKEGISAIAESQKLEVLFPKEIVTAEMSKREKKVYSAKN